MNREVVYIYGLCCPQTGDIKYIGKSKHPEKRVRQHMGFAKNRNHRCNEKLYYWLQSLYNENLIPILRIIEACNVGDWRERENYWVEFYGKDKLYNINDGGTSGEYTGRKACNAPILNLCALATLNNPQCGLVKISAIKLARALGISESQARYAIANGTNNHSHIQKLEALAQEGKDG